MVSAQLETRIERKSPPYELLFKAVEAYAFDSLGLPTLTLLFDHV